MPTPDDFPRMRIVEYEVEVSPQFSAEREVVPLFDREVSNTWAILFWAQCDTAGDVEFLGANFARTLEGDVERVKRRLSELCEAANDDMIEYLARKSSQREASDIVQIEEMTAAAAHPEDRWRMPFRANPYTY